MARPICAGFFDFPVGPFICGAHERADPSWKCWGTSSERARWCGDVEDDMKLFRNVMLPLVLCAAVTPAYAGNTSSNSSSNTSSNSSAHGSSYVHTHQWSVDSDSGPRRNIVRGSTRIERYVPNRQRYRVHRWDD